MTGQPALKPDSQTATPIKRAPRTVTVRMYDCEPDGQVPADFAVRIPDEGKAHSQRSGARDYSLPDLLALIEAGPTGGGRPT